MSRSALAILSTQNLLHNLSVIKNLSKPAKTIAMVKANAYGHGIRSVALRLDGLVDMLGVASIDEALILRQAGVKNAIILMQGVFEASELEIAATQGFEIVLNNHQQIYWLNEAKLSKDINIWLKINTGMGRLGFNMEHATNVYQQISQNSKVNQPIKIMSHFACADNINHPLNQIQINAFNQLIESFPHSQFSMSNSAAILNFPQCKFDYVRPGLLLYGISPITNKNNLDCDFKPVMSLETKLISIQNLKKGDNVGYSAQFICPEDMPVGIAAFGYGDGYPITAQNGTPVIIENIECNLIGKVSMDMITIDLRPHPTAQIGDKVLLWGEQLHLERLTSYTSIIPWNMLTSIQHRVKFIWI